MGTSPGGTRKTATATIGEFIGDWVKHYDLVEVDSMALGTNDFQRARDIRTAALKAHFEFVNMVKPQLAIRARTRATRPLDR